MKLNHVSFTIITGLAISSGLALVAPEVLFGDECVVTVVEQRQCSGPKCSGETTIEVCGSKHEDVTCSLLGNETCCSDTFKPKSGLCWRDRAGKYWLL